MKIINVSSKRVADPRVDWSGNFCFDEEFNILKDVGLFELFGIRWGIVPFFPDGKRLYKVIHYRTGVDVGIIAVSEEVEYIVDRLERKVRENSLSKDDLESFYSKHETVNHG